MLDFTVAARPRAVSRAGTLSFSGHIGVAALLCLALLLPATAAGAQHFRSPPDDPNARVPGTTYRPVISNFTRYRPVEPSSWQGVNRQVAPAPKPPSNDRR